MRSAAPAAAILLAALLAPAIIPPTAFAAPSDDAPGLGDPGQLQSISVETGRLKDGAVVISGRDAMQQFVVTGEYSTGQVRDLTRQAKYTVSQNGIVAVDATGLATPIAEGETTVHIQVGGMDATVKVLVANIAQDVPVNFPNQVVPVFTKFGCNSGGCHGKSGGQNGFALSLLGFEPTEDYEHLVKEARGRRLFPAAPERSLLLLKASAQLPHGGGHRIEADSPPYRLVKRWIAQGMPYGKESDPTVTGIEVLPPERLMEREGSQQIIVIARYSDGTTEDVTRMTQFDSNDAEMAEASVTGLVKTGRLAGSVAIMARYLGHVGVFRSTIPLGYPVENLAAPRNFVDELVYKKLQALGLPASGLADDATFLRRVTIDIAGRLPTREEAERFLADQDPNKRDKVIDSLVNSADYADYFANKWSAVLRNKRRQDFDKPVTFAFHNWIRESFLENKPYNEFVREVLAASGETVRNPPVAWYREVKDQSAQLEDTAQLFLGLRIQCARCHHHPFEKWSQQDYYGFSAFFAQVGRKKGPTIGNQANDRIYHRVGTAVARNPKTGQDVKPTGLGSEPFNLPPDADPRHAMVDWMERSDNPFFAAALVNRYWKHFFGRGLVDPEDDMRVTNPASNPELLDALAKDFIDHKFDLKHLVRTITQSRVYQLSAEPNDYNASDRQSFSRFYPRRLNAEVLLDAVDQVTGSATRFNGAPLGMRATQLPDSGFESYFLTVFGRPESSSACECERSSEANLAQSLHLLNSGEIQNKLTAGNGTAGQLAADKSRPHEAKLRDLYLATFSREPVAEELTVALSHIEKTQDDKKAYEDIVWALINTKEFLFNH
jgi:hypothetical protein